jgi:hypothetical protein
MPDKILFVKSAIASMTVSATIKRTLSVYGFAIVMALMAIIPGCNFMYSYHGGIAWLILPFAFPFALLRLYLLYRGAPAEEKVFTKRFAFISLAAYVPLSFVASFIGAYSIRNTFGLPVEPLFFWGFFTLPFGLVFSWRFFAL